MSFPRSILAATVLAAGLPLAACSVASEPGTGTAPAVSSAAQPDTAAAAKTVAQEFFALYSAGQWDAAWQYLTPEDKQQVPESLYAGFHTACPSEAAGMAYSISNVTLAGTTAVVTYTIPVLAKILGSATQAMTWTASGWGVGLTSGSLAEYSHGSVKADVAAAKAAGQCSGS